jgi:tellurite resistance protein TerC
MTLLKKILIGVLGGTLLFIGVAMIVLPGPALLVIPAALAILAIEFVWARRWLQYLRQRFRAFSRSKTPVKPVE